MVIADYLRGCGYKVLEAANSDEAISILEEGDISIDAIFAEVELPGAQDGFGLAQWIRANKPSAKVQLVGTISRAANVAAELCDEGTLMAKSYAPSDSCRSYKAALGDTRGDDRRDPIARKFLHEQISKTRFR
jgi:CheY-like chemotaxis protein